jgi:hypothetical protein
MRKNLPLLFSILTLVITLYAPRSPAQIQPAAARDFQPPQLLTPENGSTVKGAPEFFWTSAVLPKGFRGSYKLRVVALTPGQTPAAALAGNPPVHQATMRRTGEAYPADGPALKDGQTYAWGVQIVDANGASVGGTQGLSEVFVFTIEETGTPSSVQGLTIATQPLVMTGMRVGSPTIDTQPLVMTGLRVASITVNTDPLVMTGIRVESITVNTQPLVMTGMRVGSMTVDTQPLMMTGIRVGSIAINADALKMTGMRSGQPNPPIEDDKKPSKPGLQDKLKQKLELPAGKTETDDGGAASGRPPEVKEAKQKLDLPSKDTGTVDGAKPPAGQPDGAQMQQSGTGKTVGDTAVSKILGKMPSMTTPKVAETTDGDAAKSQLKQKIEANGTVDDAARDRKPAPVLPQPGTK